MTDWSQYLATSTGAPTAPAPVSSAVDANPTDYSQYLPSAQAPAYTGAVLPFVQDSAGNNSFSSDAGILGDAKRAAQHLWRAATLPGDVLTGQVDPTSPDAIGRSADLALAAGMPTSPAAGTGAAIARMATPAAAPASPTLPALFGTANSQYAQMRGLGVDYQVPAVAQHANDIQQELYSNGWSPGAAPGVHSVLDRLQNVPATSPSVPLTLLHAAAQEAGKYASTPSEAAAAAFTKSKLQDFIQNPTAQTVAIRPSTTAPLNTPLVSPTSNLSTAQQAADLLTAADGNWAAAKRSERVQGIDRAADLQASSTNSGANLDNTIRGKVKSLLLNDKQSGFYNDDEVNSLEDLVHGSPMQNRLRSVGNFAGGFGGHSLGILLGAEGLREHGFAGIAAASIPTAVKYGLKKVENNIAQSRLDAFDEAVRARSPLAQAGTPPTAPMVPGTNATPTQALTAAMLASGAARGAPYTAQPPAQPPTNTPTAALIAALSNQMPAPRPWQPGPGSI